MSKATRLCQSRSQDGLEGMEALGVYAASIEANLNALLEKGALLSAALAERKALLSKVGHVRDHQDASPLRSARKSN